MTFTSEIAALEYTSDTLMNQLNYEWDMLMMEHSENIQAIEYKVLCENGTDDDLNALYMAEAEETAQKGKEKIGGIIGLIRRIFKKLKEILLGKDTDELKNIDPNEKITLMADPEKLDNETKGIIAKLKEWISGKNLGERFVDANLDNILGAPTIIAGGAIYNHFKKLGDTSDSVDKAVAECQKHIDSHPNMSIEELGRGKKLLNMLTKAGRGITNLVKDGKDKLAEKINTSKAMYADVDDGYKQMGNYNELAAKVKEYKKYLDTFTGDKLDSDEYKNAFKKYEKMKQELDAMNAKAAGWNMMDNKQKLDNINKKIKALEYKTKSKLGMKALSADEQEDLKNLRSRRDTLEAHLKKFTGKARQNRKNIFTRHNPDANED